MFVIRCYQYEVQNPPIFIYMDVQIHFVVYL